MKYHVITLSALLLILTATPSLAWWNTGHMVVAEVAYRRLTEKAKAETDRLLAIDARPESRSFVTAACWADDLKKLDVHAYDEWHYTDVPFSPDSTPLPSPPKSNNIEWALRQCMATLKSQVAPDAEKARMLRLLLHLVGDVHMPLHCASRFTAENREGDAGGNRYLVSAGKYKNLHVYWDSGAGLFEDIDRPLNEEGRKAVGSLADRAVALLSADVSTVAAETKFSAWVTEGAAIAQSLCYTTPENGTPSDDYRKRTQETSLKQTGIAGVRLAALLNEIYK